MKTILKWIGITAVIVVALAMIVVAGIYIYDPGLSGGWVKPGIAQKELPAGVDTSVVFENVTVIPMDSQRVLEGQTVIVEEGRIAQLGPAGEIELPADAHVVDGEGRFLIPGLSDMHIHLQGSENDLLMYLANGVTTIRDMGDGPRDYLKWRDEIQAGTRTGPNLWVWSPSIRETSEGDPEWVVTMVSRGGITYAHTPEEAEKLVARFKAQGYDGIKTKFVFSSELYQAHLESAARHGLPLDGHAPEDHIACPDNPNCVCPTRLACWNDFRTMGVPAIAHLEELIKVVEWSDESIRQAAQDAADDGLWVTTTVYLMRSIADQSSDLEGTLAAMPEVKYVHPGVFDAFGWGPGANRYAEFTPDYLEYLAVVEKMLLALNESGALLMSGTDVPVPVMVPGFSLHDEFETMADVGLPPYDVLRTSTYNPALYLGELDEFGTVEEGKRADLVLLEGNPLEDIANTQQIAGVMVRGRWYSRADLDSMLEAVAQDYEAVKSNQTIIRIAFPVVVILLLVGLVWFIVRRARRRKARQVSS